MIYTLRRPKGPLTGTITLAGSKSISNRALIIRALCGTPFPIEHLANARDTELLQALLNIGDKVRDAGAAGTTFRFLTAYLALQPGTQVLTGTERMKQRPIRVLVDALRRLGAQIEYLENEGYPPLQIGSPEKIGQAGELTITAGTSSQYISALLLIAPTLPGGLRLKLEGQTVSRPYIEMTLGLMQYFGVGHSWEGNTIEVRRQDYAARPFRVEADWSAASYYYAMAALSGDEVGLQLNGLFADSMQGDAVLSEMMQHFGVATEFNDEGIRLTKTAKASTSDFEWDFLRCPDLAQTLAVVCGALGTGGRFCGLETLRIKETDRIAALQAELSKVGAGMEALPAGPQGRQYYAVKGKAQWGQSPTFATYEDHRMAMAFAPLALLGEIRVSEPMVVVKSYPSFWEDLRGLGFEVE
ncbi:MAG: 3-phosphoshikimate 1-carboxyvinyltransferase [Phaeodactylibacter sp.]|nr:3-phosphoshikimate 1-carboxyvinyltransferase [Phaeodactylibacter sp.]